MKNTRGFTLIEMSFVIAIIGLLLVAAGTKLRDYAIESSGEKLGNEAAALLGSVNTYTAQYFEEIMNGTAIPGVANNLAPSIAELKVVGGLSASFPTTNSQNTGWTIGLDNRVPAGCTPPACDIESLVSTDAGILDLDGSGVPDLKVLGSAMKRMEAQGVRAGISDENVPGTISGQGASWTAPNPAGNVAGVLAAKGGFGSSGYSQFVRMGDSRNVTLSGDLAVNGANGVTATKMESGGTLTVAGQTTLTGAATLNSTLAVGGATTLSGALAANNGITTTTVVASGRVTAQYLLPSTTVTGAAACSPNGLIAKDATGSGMVCVSGKWVLSSTKPCVPGSASYTTAGVHQLIIPENCTITVTTIGGGGSGGSASNWDSDCGGKGGCEDIEASGGGGGGKGYSASTTFYQLNQTYVYVVVGGGAIPGPARGNGNIGGASYISYASTQSAAATAPQVATALGGAAGTALVWGTHNPGAGGAGAVAGSNGLMTGFHTNNPTRRCGGGAGGGSGAGKGGNGGSGTSWWGCTAPGAAGNAGQVALSWN